MDALSFMKYLKGIAKRFPRDGARSTTLSIDGHLQVEEGHFIDLQISVPPKGDERVDDATNEGNGDEEEEEEAEHNISLSLPASSADLNTELHGYESASKIRVLFRPATNRFRIFMLKLNKSKQANADGCHIPPPESQQNQRNIRKLFAFKLKINDFPVTSFTSARNPISGESTSVNQRMAKDVVRRCIHMFKSVNVLPSKSSAEPLMTSDNSLASCPRDDSLLQQQDGIQSAILYCKRSFNRSCDSGERLSSMSRTMPIGESAFFLQENLCEPQGLKQAGLLFNEDG